MDLSTLDNLRAQRDVERRALSAFETATRKDGNLSAAGKEAAIAARRKEARAAIAHIEQQLSDQKAIVRRELASTAFAPPSKYATSDQLVAYRLGQMLAAQANGPQGRREMIDRASYIGDTDLVRAVAHVAYTAGDWSSLELAARADSAVGEFYGFERRYGNVRSVAEGIADLVKDVTGTSGGNEAHAGLRPITGSDAGTDT